MKSSINSILDLIKAIYLLLFMFLPSWYAIGQKSGISRRAEMDMLALKKQPIKVTRTLTENKYTSIHIGKKDTFGIGVDSIFADTLTMDDKAALRFLRPAVLIVENAFIGNECLISSAGQEGRAYGTNGESGKNISLVIVFKSLGSLTIDTSGANGVAGERGRTNSSNDEVYRANGQGGPGGNGGSAGSLTMFYACDGFHPRFNGDGSLSIRLRFFGGKAGVGGVGLPRGSVGKTYPRGSSGTDGEDGELKLERINNP